MASTTPNIIKGLTAMDTNEKCPHCGADWIPSLRKFGCMTYQKFFEIHQSDLCKERSAHAATKRELENTKSNLNHRLEVYKAEIRDLYRSIDPLKSRVRELEGLASQVVRAWKAFDLAEGDWERTDSERALSNSITTLGEAMPQQKGGQS